MGSAFEIKYENVFKNNIINGSFMYKTGKKRRYNFIATGSYGHSIFWRRKK